MNADIILINSPISSDKIENQPDEISPLGLGYIATRLSQCSHSVTIFDAYRKGASEVEIISYIENCNCKIIGFNIFSVNHALVKRIVTSVKRSVRFVLGGIATKSLYKEIFDWETANRIDIIYGDGENITCALIHTSSEPIPTKYQGNKFYYEVDNNSFYYVKDISELELDHVNYTNGPYNNFYGKSEVAISTSRGCHHNCAFCSAATSMNSSLGIRIRSNESILQELKYLKDCYYDVESIRVIDDLFLRNKTSINSAADIFTEAELLWRSMAHVKSFKDVDDKSLSRLKQSGCTELFIGIESGSPRILKKINKSRENIDVCDVLDRIFAAKINVKGYFIVGFPSETVFDFNKTLNLATDIKNISKKQNVLFRTSTFQFRPYHGTKLYHDLNERGTITCDHFYENKKLTEKSNQRKLYNYIRGNFSSATDEEVDDYIHRIQSLNQN